MDYEVMETITSNMTVRSERSLGLLTIKFVTLLQEAKDGVVNLKEVSEDLCSSPGALLLPGSSAPLRELCSSPGVLLLSGSSAPPRELCSDRRFQLLRPHSVILSTYTSINVDLLFTFYIY